MATPDWLASTERIVGASHPLYANTKDRCGQTIQSMIEVEHSTDGVHDARSTGLSGEIGTFVGNETARTISLSNSGLTPKKAFVWGPIDTTERVTNGGFETDTTGWTFTGDGSATGGQAGGQAGNCVAIANNGTAPDYISQTITGLIPGRRYTFSVYYKDGTITSGSGYTDLSGAHTGGAGFTSGAGWTQQTESFTATTDTLTIELANNENVQTGTILFDTCSLVEITGSDATRIDLMDSEKAQPSRYRQVAWRTNVIDNFQEGSFDIEEAPNSSGTTIYYFVLGYDTGSTPTGDTGAGSDPTWITSSTANLIIADDSADVDAENVANSVESEIWTQFLEEHTAAGAHSITLQHERIETISWSGNDADDRAISCVITDLDITHIEVYEDGDHVYSKSSDMSGDNTKLEDTAAFAANMIQDITTNGEFEVGTGLNASGSTYVAFLVGV